MDSALGHVILIDSGATGDLFTSSLMERYCKPENLLEIDTDVRKQYRYADGAREVCCSQATAETALGVLKIDVREAGFDRPSLIGMKTIKKHIVDFEKLTMTSRTDGGRSIKMYELPSGHVCVKAVELFTLPKDRSI